MAQLSAKRKAALAADAAMVHDLYAAACTRFGAAAVRRQLTLVWTLRCMQGCTDELPFGATVSRTMGELLYVARHICGYGEETA